MSSRTEATSRAAKQIDESLRRNAVGDISCRRNGVFCSVSERLPWKTLEACYCVAHQGRRYQHFVLVDHRWFVVYRRPVSDDVVMMSPFRVCIFYEKGDGKPTASEV
jgi:hypothetical protein